MAFPYGSLRRKEKRITDLRKENEDLKKRIENLKKSMIYKTKKKKVWIIRVSKQLDKQTRDHVNKYGWSLAGFVRKSVGYLIESEAPELEENNKSVLWVVQVHPELDDSMRKLAKANYPCMSDLIRYAVCLQLSREET